MPKSDYTAFFALDPFFAVVMDWLSSFVDGEHYSDTLDDDVLFEFIYDFPGKPVSTSRSNILVRNEMRPLLGSLLPFAIGPSPGQQTQRRRNSPDSSCAGIGPKRAASVITSRTSSSQK